jgi:hypothetical protein
MLQHLMSEAGYTPYLTLLTAVSVHTRQLALLAGFLVAVRGTSEDNRSEMFSAFARHMSR